jgi:hypothetical protein|nr:hypothetical protein [Kofleriaceae bacterium]
MTIARIPAMTELAQVCTGGAGARTATCVRPSAASVVAEVAVVAAGPGGVGAGMARVAARSAR